MIIHNEILISKTNNEWCTCNQCVCGLWDYCNEINCECCTLDDEKILKVI